MWNEEEDDLYNCSFIIQNATVIFHFSEAIFIAVYRGNNQVKRLESSIHLLLLSTIAMYDNEDISLSLSADFKTPSAFSNESIVNASL